MSFTMDIVDKDEVQEMIKEEVKVVSEDALKLQEQAENNAQAIMNLDLDSLEEKKKFIQSIESFGLETMELFSQKNSLLKVSVGNLSKASDEGSIVSKSLTDLQREIKDLDPSLIDFTKTGFLGKIINPIRGYFTKYEKAENVIMDILESLEKGRIVLKNDNTTLSIEQHNLRELTKKINKELEMGSMMDECISVKIEQERAIHGDTEHLKFVEEEILFPLRHRIMDLQQMVVVNNQGIIAMEIIQRNNKELMRGVERAKNITVSALRTAVMVASALYNQKIVLSKINALNETTNNLIGATSKMLKTQGTEIHKQSIQTGVSVEVLKESFKDLTMALDEIHRFKQEALPMMKNTIQEFKLMADEGERQIEKLEKGNILT